MTDQCPKYQWTGVFTNQKNGVAVNENFTLRMDTEKEIMDARQKILDFVVPAVEAFPNDSGPKAHTEDQTAPVVYCSVHGTQMTLRPAGISKSTGKAYTAFWACNTKNADGSFCKAKPKE
jgi:hypothetical protein